MDGRSPCSPPENPKKPLSCRLIGFFLLACLGGAMTAAVVIHLDLLRFLTSSPLLRAHAFCAAMGMLGATVAAIRKYYQALITESAALARGEPIVTTDWSLGRVYYYVTRPVLGAVLGAMMYLLSFVGFQVLAEPDNVPLSREGIFLLYALAFLAGFGVSNVLDKLQAACDKFFKRNKGPDHGGN